MSLLQGLIECEHPNENLMSFEGRITCKGEQKQIAPLSLLNMALRGSVLRNTDWCYALVVYSGSNTKIIKNLKESVSKVSTMEKKLNYIVLGAFGVNIIILVASVVLEYFLYTQAIDQQSSRKAQGFTD